MAIDVRILRSSFNALAPRAEALARAFYAKLFERHPDLKPLFDHTDMADQVQKLVRALTVIVRSVDDSAVLSGFLMRMGRTHLEYGVIDEHYDAVGETLLDTLAEFAGSTLWTTAIENTWREAIHTVCELMRAGAASAEAVQEELVVSDQVLVGAGVSSHAAVADSPRDEKPAPLSSYSGVSLRQEPAGGDPTDIPKDPDMTLGTIPQFSTGSQAQGDSGKLATGIDATHFYAVAEASPSAIFIENADGTLAFLNARGQEAVRRMASALGGGPEKFVGQAADVLTSRIAGYPVLAGRAPEARAKELPVGSDFVNVSVVALSDGSGRRIGSATFGTWSPRWWSNGTAPSRRRCIWRPRAECRPRCPRPARWTKRPVSHWMSCAKRLAGPTARSGG